MVNWWSSLGGSIMVTFVCQVLRFCMICGQVLILNLGVLTVLYHLCDQHLAFLLDVSPVIFSNGDAYIL